MRLFQEIEGADVFYINTYAATTPRLSVFKGICNNAKDNGEDDLSDGDWAELTKVEVPSIKDFKKFWRNPSQAVECIYTRGTHTEF